MRQAFVKGDPKALPAAMQNLPDATAVTFDWTTRVTGPRHIIRQLEPHCWVYFVSTAAGCSASAGSHGGSIAGGVPLA